MPSGLILLTLELRTALLYLPLAAVADAGGSAAFPPPREEGGDHLFVLRESSFLSDGEGPRCPAPLAGPVSSWCAADETSPLSGEPCLRLEAGSWLFTQWRSGKDEGPAAGDLAADDLAAGDLARGLEWFAREAWWQRRALEGPWLLRLVKEDGRIACQALRRLSDLATKRSIAGTTAHLSSTA